MGESWRARVALALARAWIMGGACQDVGGRAAALLSLRVRVQMEAGAKTPEGSEGRRKVHGD